MQRFLQIGTLFLWFLQCLLLFLLVFQESFELPLAGIGHLHPLILHLPIGFGVLLALFSVVKKQFEQIEILFQSLLVLTALFSTATAIFGLFLAKEGGYEAEQITWHQWSGVAVSFVYFAWVLWQKSPLMVGILGVLTLIFAGHTGASITHGADYLQFGEQKEAITNESIAFEALVQPILKTKCESCHNEQKSKGGLKMNTLANLLKGGKNGPIWKAGDLNSHLLQRMNLPLNNKKHMPPAGKAQLTADEQLILTLWIKEGAKVEQKVGAYSKVFQNLATKQQETTIEPVYDFSAASEKDIAAVNTPFCSVYPIAYDSPALQAEFFVAAKFDPKSLENLSKVSEQLIGINLNKMPVSDADLNILTKFLHLERLHLNATKVSYRGVVDLLKKLPNLKTLAIWNTVISNPEITQLKKQFPKVSIEQTVVLKNETLQINPPILVNEKLILRPNEQLSFKHTINDVVFRYTVNDSLPDSLSRLQTKGIVPIKNYTKVRIIATKPDWYASNPVDVKVYKSNFVPHKIDLLSTPSPKYPAKGGMSLMDFEQGAREVKGVPNLTWLGFKDTDLDALASFQLPTKVNGLTFSYLEKTDADVFPPTKIEIWAGNDSKNLKLIASFSPIQPKEKSGYNLKGINIPISTVPSTYYRIKAHRNKKLPSFVDNKGKGAWLKVDEVVFY
ncbi:peptidylprolyl isomerase [Sandaracinomonas limnophila]|uniref:Peptidylprolyl isomerase n=1 Tax=Sandaracinomonas limnophila TaxID=1862386 RepID=A0A437PPT5_9BACT|nr:c-type cytochrome domain-containing protein [Sandaracinomonas limnophila]RVU24114.1 peptidylprolyl isomerase [Sandaracinomonas limnophila]